MRGLPALPPAVIAACRLLILLLALGVPAAGAPAGPAPKDAPPGIVIEPEPKQPGAADEDEEDDGPAAPGGPGCPVNDRPLELLV